MSDTNNNNNTEHNNSPVIRVLAGYFASLRDQRHAEEDVLGEADNSNAFVQEG